MRKKKKKTEQINSIAYGTDLALLRIKVTVNTANQMKIESVTLLRFPRFSPLCLFRLSSLDVPSVPGFSIRKSVLIMLCIVWWREKRLSHIQMVWFVCLSVSFSLGFHSTDLMSFYLLFLFVNNESENVNMHRMHHGSRDHHTHTHIFQTQCQCFSTTQDQQQLAVASKEISFRIVTSAKLCRRAYWNMQQMKQIHNTRHQKAVIQFLTHFGRITIHAQWFFKMLPFSRSFCWFFQRVLFSSRFGLLCTFLGCCLNFLKRINRFSTWTLHWRCPATSPNSNVNRTAVETHTKYF